MSYQVHVLNVFFLMMMRKLILCNVVGIKSPTVYAPLLCRHARAAVTPRRTVAPESIPQRRAE